MSNNIALVLNSLSNTTTIEQSIGASTTNTTTNTTTYVYTTLTISNFISLVASLSVMSERCVEIFWGCANCIIFYIFKVSKENAPYRYIKLFTSPILSLMFAFGITYISALFDVFGGIRWVDAVAVAIASGFSTPFAHAIANIGKPIVNVSGN